jgi:polygalacturonase
VQKFQDAIIRSDGRAVVGATVTVTTVAGGTPTLYSDNGTTPYSSNVLTTDSTGEYSFYAVNGRYNLAITAPSITSETKADVVLFDPADAGVVSLVELYGVTGNGTTDDTAALEAAINSGVKTVEIPAGYNCLVSSEVDFDTAGVHLKAYGAKFTKHATFTGSCVLRIDNQNVTIEGLEIDGTDNADDGLITNATADGFRLLNCTIYGCLYGISALNISNLELSGNRVSAVTRYCARVYNTADTRILTRWRVLNNKFDQSDQEPTETIT